MKIIDRFKEYIFKLLGNPFFHNHKKKQVKEELEDDKTEHCD
jgi:hypothetical protein